MILPPGTTDNMTPVQNLALGAVAILAALGAVALLTAGR